MKKRIGRIAGKLKAVRLPIRARVLAVLVALASVCSVVVSSMLLSYFNEDKAMYIQDLNADLATNTAASAGMLLKFYRDRLVRLAEGFSSATEPAAELARLFEKNEDLLYLAIYDEERRNVVNVCRERWLDEAGIDTASFRAVRETLDDAPSYVRSRGVVVKNSSVSPKLLTFAMAIPFFARSYDQRFTMRAEFSAEAVMGAIRRAPGFRTYIVDQLGKVFVHPDTALMAKQESLGQRKVVQALLVNLGRSAAGTGEFEEPGERPVLASYASVRDMALGVIVARPKDDAYLAASHLTRRSVRAALLIILISGIFSVLLSRRLTAPLLELSRAAARLERGDFDVRVEPRTHDELGDLARGFNLAAAGLKERDEKLKETYDQLLQSEKLSAFGKFSAGIAHEIKNPLTGIIGYAQLLARKLAADDPKLRPLQLIEKEGKRCKSILDNLLRFTRKEGLSFEPVRMHAHIRETLDLVAPQLGVSHVAATTDFGASDDLIRGDPNQLRQVFMNLILNAVDAMESVEDRRIVVATRDGGEGGIEVRVTDSGSGIPEDKIRRIFDPFFSTKEPGKGTGLGLSVSYGIVNNHGGRISVRSQPGQGAEFRLIFPGAPADIRARERVDDGKGREAPASSAVA